MRGFMRSRDLQGRRPKENFECREGYIMEREILCKFLISISYFPHFMFRKSTFRNFNLDLIFFLFLCLFVGLGIKNENRSIVTQDKITPLDKISIVGVLVGDCDLWRGWNGCHENQ